MLFSIIVPVYKVEKYLPHCIESLIHQSFSDFELILVNDGSPDNSGKICDIYAEQDKRIRVLHKANGGVSDARNSGISMASGEFIWFLDSDDYMVPNSLFNVAEMIKNSPEVDMITCSHINSYENGDQKLVSLPIESSLKNIDRNEFLYLLYNSSGSYWAPWKNIYKRSIIEKNILFFSKGLIGAEDCDFFMRYVRHGNKFSLLNNPVVYYRMDRKGSITNIMSKEAILGQLIVFYDNYKVFEIDINLKNKDMVVFFANKFTNTISLLYHLRSKGEIIEVTKFVEDRKWILNNVKGKKYKIAKLVWTIFGYYKGSKILRILNRR